MLKCQSICLFFDSDSSPDPDPDRLLHSVFFLLLWLLLLLLLSVSGFWFLVSASIVNYGAAHAHAHGHSQFGRTHARGLYPEWSRARPLHFVGHSMGGATLAVLITLVRNGFFSPGGDGCESDRAPEDQDEDADEVHPDMIASITTVSAPFRGTQLVYDLGEDVKGSSSVRHLSVRPFMARHLRFFAHSNIPFHWLLFSGVE